MSNEEIAAQQISWTPEMLDLLIATWREMLIGRIMDSKTKRLGVAYQRIADNLAQEFQHLVNGKQLKDAVKNKIKYLKQKYYDAVKMNKSGAGRDDIPRKCPQYDQLHDFLSDRRLTQIVQKTGNRQYKIKTKYMSSHRWYMPELLVIQGLWEHRLYAGRQCKSWRTFIIFKLN